MVAEVIEEGVLGEAEEDEEGAGGEGHDDSRLGFSLQYDHAISCHAASCISTGRARRRLGPDRLAARFYEALGGCPDYLLYRSLIPLHSTMSLLTQAKSGFGGES